MSGEFDIGDQLRLKGTFTDPNNSGAKIDPSEVTLRYTKPDGTKGSETYNGGAGNVVKSETGVYYYLLTIDASGQWFWKMLGTGNAVAAEEWGFHVKEERAEA